MLKNEVTKEAENDPETREAEGRATPNAPTRATETRPHAPATETPALDQGGEGVRETPPPGVLNMGFGEGNFEATVAPAAKKKKSAPPAPAGEGAARAPCAVAGVSPPPQGVAAPEPFVATVTRLCPNPRIVWAKVNPSDPKEDPKSVFVHRIGKLRKGQRIRLVPLSDGSWKHSLYRQVPGAF